MSDFDPDQYHSDASRHRFDYDPGDNAFLAEGTCAQVGPDIFFPGKGGIGASEAKKICRVCPVKDRCLEYTLRTEQPAHRFGIWGETSPRERDRIWAQRGAAAPV